MVVDLLAVQVQHQEPSVSQTKKLLHGETLQMMETLDSF